MGRGTALSIIDHRRRCDSDETAPTPALRASLYRSLADQVGGCGVSSRSTMTAVKAYGGEAGPRLVDHYLSYDIRPDASFVGYAGLVL